MQEPGQGPGEVQKEPPQVAPEAEEGRVEDEEEEVEGALAVEEEPCLLNKLTAHGWEQQKVLWTKVSTITT